MSRLKAAVAEGRARVLYVIDPGPDGSIGDVDWVLAARQAGTIKTLIVQGVLHTPLADAADIVLPGSAFVEKDATYTNMTGHVQAASRVIQPPGDAVEDWQILDEARRGVRRQRQLHVDRRRFAKRSPRRSPPRPDTPRFGRSRSRGRCPRKEWLQASNPSERWKWDFMFQDLPPVKFSEEFGPLPRAEVIPLKEVK